MAEKAPGRLMRIREVQDRTSLKRSTLYNVMGQEGSAAGQLIWAIPVHRLRSRHSLCSEALSIRMAKQMRPPRGALT